MILHVHLVVVFLAHLGVGVMGTKLEELSNAPLLPQRDKESHFPSQPDLPSLTSGKMFVLLSETNETEEANIIAEDTPGLPLGFLEGDFAKVSMNEETISDDAVVLQAQDPLETSGLFEGDINGVKLTSVNEGEESTSQSWKNAIKNTYQLWPDGEVPYVISNAFGSQERSVIRAAMEQFSRNSCLKWRPHVPTDVGYVHILRDKGCYSSVGRSGRAQILSLGYGCVNLGTVIHEMLHTAGFWHEQSRPDRDEHVVVLWQNIQPGLEDNFARYSRAEVSTLDLPYDTSSVMHYGPTAFSRNGQYTITPLKTKVSVMGQRRGFSQLDIEKLNKLYQCQNLAPVTTLVPDPHCKDRYQGQSGLCQTWKSEGGCKSYPMFMKDQCPRSCGLCPLIPSPLPNPIVVASKCSDKDKRCPAWAAYANQCQTNRLFMSKMCKQTCGLCSAKDNEDSNLQAEEHLQSSDALPSIFLKGQWPPTLLLAFLTLALMK